MSFGFINTETISLENFVSDVNPVDFVNQVSSLAVDTKGTSYDREQDNDGDTYLDPVPYISSLKKLQEKISSITEECDAQRQKYEQSAKIKEKQHFQNVISKSTVTDDLKFNFNSLLSNVENYNSTTMDPLSEKLKKANNVRQHSINIIFLMRCYNHFYVNNEPPMELLTDKQRGDTIETAKNLSQLKQLARKLSEDKKLSNAEAAYQSICKFSDVFEDDQLKSFNTYYQSKNFARLQKIARNLFAYNNGINIVDSFVNRHQIFVELQDKVKSKVSDDYWNKIRDPSLNLYTLDPGSTEILEAVRDTVLNELDSISTIFQENSSQAISSLLFKLCENIIEPRLSLLLATASSQSKLSYLRVLHSYSNGISQMSFTQLRSTLLDRNIDLNIEFDKIYSSLFNKYLLNNSYFKLEKENLESMIDFLIGPFEELNKSSLRERKLTNKIMKFKEQDEYEDFEAKEYRELSNPFEEGTQLSNRVTDESKFKSTDSSHGLNLYLPDTRIFRDRMKRTRNYVSNNQKIKKISNFLKINEKSSLFDRYKNSYNNSSEHELIKELTISEVDKSQLSLPITQKIYKLILESLTRSIELIPAHINSNSIELFKIMLYKIGPSYIALGLESIYDNFIEAQMKNKSVFRGIETNIDLSFISNFNTIFTQLYLLSTVVKKSFLPLISRESDVDFISNSFNIFLQDVEIGINIILNDLVNLIQTRISLILSKQSVNDYIVLNNDPEKRTPTSELLTAFMENILQSVLLERKIDTTLRMEFITKISNYLLTSLIVHLSHLKVTANGFSSLTNDLRDYILIFANISDMRDISDIEKEQLLQIQDAYKILNDLSGLYNCQPESLNDFCTEGRLNDLKRSVIRDYVSNRQDFKSWFLKNI